MDDKTKADYEASRHKFLNDQRARQQEQEMQRIAMHKMQAHRAVEPLDVAMPILTLHRQ